MAEGNVGTLSLGMKLDQSSIMQQLSTFAAQASKILQGQLSGVKVDASSFNTKGLAKEISSVLGSSGVSAEEIGDALRVSMETAIQASTESITAAMDRAAAAIGGTLNKSIAGGMTEGAVKGSAAVAKAVDSVKVPKIQAELSEGDYSRQFEGLESQINLVDGRIRTLNPRLEELHAKLAMTAKTKMGSSEGMQKTQDEVYKVEKEIQNLITAQDQLIIKQTAVENKLGSFSKPIIPAAAAVDTALQKIEDSTKGIETAFDEMRAKSAASVNGISQTVGNMGVKEAGQDLQALNAISTDSLRAKVQAVGASINTLGSEASKSSSVTSNSFNAIKAAVGGVTPKMQQARNALGMVAATGMSLGAKLAQPFRRATVEGSIFGRTVGKISGVAKQAGAAMKAAFNKPVQDLANIGRNAKSASRSVEKVGKSASRSSSLFRKLGKAGLALIGIRSVFQGIRRLVSGVGESLGFAARQNGAFGATMNGLTKSMSTFKGSLGAAVAPLITFFAPALNFVAAMATKAMNAVARFFAALTGQKSVMIAVGSTKTFTQAQAATTKATDKASKSKADAVKVNEKLKRSLAGFDELEILDTGKDDSPDGVEDPGIGDSFDAPDLGGVSEAGPIFQEVAVQSFNLKDKLAALWAELSKIDAFRKLGEAAKTAFGVIKTAAENGWARVKSSWEENGPGILASTKNILANIGNFFANIGAYIIIPYWGGRIAAALDIGSALVDNFLISFNAFLDMVDKILQPFADAVNGFFDRHGPEIAEKIYATWRVISDGISGILDGIGEIFRVTFGGIRDWFVANGPEITATLTNTFEKAWAIIGPLWDKMLAGARKIFGAIKSFMYEVAPQIRDVFVSAIQLMWDIVKPIWNTILSVAITIFTKLKVFWDKWGGDIKAGFSLIWTAIKSAFSLALSSITTVFKTFSALFSGDFKGFWTGIKTFWSNLVNGLGSAFTVFIQGISRIFQGFAPGFSAGILQHWTGVQTIFRTAFNAITQLFGAFKSLFSGDFKGFWNGIKSFIGTIWTGLTSGFNSVFNGIRNIFSIFGRDVQNIVTSIKGIFNGVVTFFTGVFTGNWRKAFNGLSTIVRNVFEGLKSIVKAPINWIIDGVNKMIGGLNKMKIPDWVPGVGGRGISIPKIPKMARGGIIDSPTIAMVGEAGKEAVMPLERNTGWIDMLAQKLSANGGGGGDIYLTTTVVLDSGEIVEVIEQKIDRKARQGNKPAFA